MKHSKMIIGIFLGFAAATTIMVSTAGFLGSDSYESYEGTDNSTLPFTVIGDSVAYFVIKGSGGDDKSKSRYSNTYTIHNILFADENLNPKRLLKDSLMIIHQYFAPSHITVYNKQKDVQEVVGTKPYFLYNIVDRNTNENEGLDYEDKKAYYMSAADGTGFKRISPYYNIIVHHEYKNLIFFAHKNMKDEDNTFSAYNLNTGKHDSLKDLNAMMNKARGYLK